MRRFADFAALPVDGRTARRRSAVSQIVLGRFPRSMVMVGRFVVAGTAKARCL
ncbi:hypothetical protein SNOG_09111 [Parastagonospora nodorum SN15]|uniref:Uncharacterized protein n=1 Tax=Phaeosphaeria nodorum (strain SN15 / ATCC MYA-4574 / FGSC 10173) TaxID=321614 RepID=Q0UGK3_PHANO|nr:hypothetical protein SNOG_09111 [Parastagonospora nodorum SN15]EAT83303.1 hypothetical protein SNOG_09111 [Parastagonospora nodorum SN15]